MNDPETTRVATLPESLGAPLRSKLSAMRAKLLRVEILRRLTSFFGPTRTYVYLDSWQFIESERRYVIEIEITWGSTFLRRRWYRIAGILEVSEEGGEASFRRTRSNDRGTDRWRDRVDGDELRLRALQPRPGDDDSFRFDRADE